MFLSVEKVAGDANVKHLREVLPCRTMSRLVPVSQKGQVVIPAKMRKKLKIGKAVIMSEEANGILIRPSTSMEESFGAGGKIMLDAAGEISRDRRREVESERS